MEYAPAMPRLSQQVSQQPLQLPQLRIGQAFPPVDQAWGPDSPACGLLAAGGALDVQTLVRAYSKGIFPWFSDGQPILWWSTDPRMTLDVTHFKLHRSLKQGLQRFMHDTSCEIRMDTAFDQVITACAETDRSAPVDKLARKKPEDGTAGKVTGEIANELHDERPNGTISTWIVPDMVQAYIALHRAGFAHSVEVWVRGELAGGLYCVALGKAVFGESMFSRRSNASKIALAALVSFCRFHGIRMIDCQQNTRHLASLGAAEMPRSAFVSHVAASAPLPGPQWQFLPLYWTEILPTSTPGS